MRNVDYAKRGNRREYIEFDNVFSNYNDDANDIEKVKKCVENGEDVNEVVRHSTKLLRASRYGNAEVVEYLLKHGANVDCVYYDDTPLKIAAKHGYADIVKILLKYGANVNYPNSDSGDTALVLAAGYGHIDIVKILLEFGANKFIGEYDEEYDRDISRFITPLVSAASAGYFDIVKLLVDGVKYDKDEIVSAIKEAYLRNHKEIAHFLINLE